MASHIYLALQSRTRPVRPAEWGEYLAGAVAPDVRYLAPTIPREVSHSWSLGLNLAGPFGAGYRHHLAVDQSFYRRCEERKGLGRLGAMNLTILAELYALRRLTGLPALGTTAVDPSLLAAGVPGDALGDFLVLSNDYLRHRDIDQAVQLLTGSLRERAARYLDKWARWGDHLRLASRVAAPILHHFFGSIQAEAEESLEKARP